VAITLQSTVGGFPGEFLRKLPRREQAMIAHGLEPSQFVISKDRATPPAVPFIGRSSVTTPYSSATRTSPSQSRTTSGSWIIFTSAASLTTIPRRRRRPGAYPTPT
jgi:hypothetical protein